MNWERIESARARARFLLAIPVLCHRLSPSRSNVGAFLHGPDGSLVTISGLDSSRGATGIPVDAIPLAVRVFGMLIGFAWMWRIYRAPTRVEGANWRFHDD